MPKPTKYQIDINSDIGYWGTSKKDVARILKENAGKAINVRINSPGGSLDHGLDIMNRFREHGEVTAYLYGMNASSATIASLGAKKILMDQHGLYLIHKVSNWVGFFGFKNADELETLIQELQDNKEENDKIDQVLIGIYAQKTGLDEYVLKKLLKKGGWITAQQALDYGFVDGLISTGIQNEKTNYLSGDITNKLEELNLPALTPDNFAISAPDYVNEMNEDAQREVNLFSRLEAFFDRFLNKKTDTEQPKPKTMEKKDLTKLNSVLGVEAITLTDGKLNLNEEQLTKINEALTNEESKTNQLTETKTALEEKVAELEAQVKNLEKKPAETTGKVDKTDDERKKNDSAVTGIDLLNEIKGI